MNRENLTTKDTKNTKKEEEGLFAAGDKENFRDFRAFRGYKTGDLRWKKWMVIELRMES